MAPSAIDDTIHHSGFPVSEKKYHLPNGAGDSSTSSSSYEEGFQKSDYIFDRHLHKVFPVVTRASGNWLSLKDGRQIFDTTCGAAVSCLGHGNKRVLRAMWDQMETGVIYMASTFFTSPVAEDFCEELIRGTNWQMSRVYLTGSGWSS